LVAADQPSTQSDNGNHTGQTQGNGSSQSSTTTTTTTTTSTTKKTSTPSSSNRFSGNSDQGVCGTSHTSDTGHGANHSGPYDPNCVGAQSANGNGGGQAGGRPCAGCVGNADAKNPHGQYPNANADGNKGYECDKNHGIAKGNPAH